MDFALPLLDIAAALEGLLPSLRCDRLLMPPDDDLEEMADRSEFLSDWPDTIDA